MTTTVRERAEGDLAAVTALALRAWQPVFAAMADVLGPSGVFARLYPDWRSAQRQAVEDTCTGMRCWVGEVDGVVAGFVAARVDADAGMGEVVMLAVDPDHQRAGLGAALTAAALDWFRAEGMPVAMVETGGDPGHAPARRVYERAGFTAMPVARYFRTL